jgi:hypothetical protein
MTRCIATLPFRNVHVKGAQQHTGDTQLPLRRGSYHNIHQKNRKGRHRAISLLGGGWEGRWPLNSKRTCLLPIK